ncbi:MAG TPA: hypothetical protein VLF87_04070 [Patescibacteria group bacterium]|nr:hypothetical protein [Patescibacteria group bacterium]
MDFWHKQSPSKPLFPDLLWSRPENRAHAGKLLVIGGNVHGFSAPASAFAEAAGAGAGTVRAILPDAVKRLAGAVLPALEYAPSTPSGSFSQQAAAELLDQSTWADGVLLAGDFGRNSETAIVLEKFLNSYSGQVTLAKDSVDYALSTVSPLTENNRLYVLTMAELQRLGTRLGLLKPITFGMDLLQLVRALHDITLEHEFAIIVKHLEQLFVAVDGQVSTTKLAEDPKTWRVKTATYAAVWWLQNPDKPFEALTIAQLNDIKGA